MRLSDYCLHTHLQIFSPVAVAPAVLLVRQRLLHESPQRFLAQNIPCCKAHILKPDHLRLRALDISIIHQHGPTCASTHVPLLCKLLEVAPKVDWVRRAVISQQVPQILDYDVTERKKSF